MKSKRCRTPLNDMIEIKTPDDGIFEPSTLVGSPGGSKNGKLRYFIVLSWEKGGKLSLALKKRLQSATEEVASEANMVEVEDIEYAEGYVLLTMLVSFDKALGEVADDTIILANGTKPFLRFHYYVTNVARPDEDEIREYIGEI